MDLKPDYLGNLHRKNMEAAMHLVKESIESSQRIVSIQIDLAKILFKASVDNVKAITSANDPTRALTLRSQHTMATMQTLVDAASEISEIRNTSRAEFSKVVSEMMVSRGYNNK